MAIVKMKKLRLLAVRDSKEELLKELIRHGCVEFAEAEDALTGSEAAAFVHRESSELSKLKTQHQTLVHAIDLLNTYAPKKTKMLSAKPELEPQVLLDDTGLTGALKTAEAIEGYDARIKRIAAEESLLIATICLLPKLYLTGDSIADFPFHIIEVLCDPALVDEPAKPVGAMTVREMKMIPDEVGVIGLALLGLRIGVEVCDGHGVGVQSPQRN